MSLLDSVARAFFSHRKREIDRLSYLAIDRQKQLLQRLVHMAAKTEWGEKHGYSDIRYYPHFAQQVPLQDYNSLKGFIARMMDGERSVLWPGKVSWYSKSSGTTQDKSKYLPVSKEALEETHYRGGKDLYSLYSSAHAHSQIYTGKALVMGGSHKLHHSSIGNTRNGDISAVLLQNLPWWARMHRVPRMEVALMDDWEKKLVALAKAAIKEDIRQIVGVPTWTVLLIQKVYEISGTDNLKKLWPNLEVYVHGGVSFTPYIDLFKRLIPDPQMRYWETYNASEGFFAIQDRAEDKEMRLLVDHGIFYEFIPLNELGDPDAAIPLWEVETGVKYAVVITTNAGLWRYQIGDTIEFSSLMPHRLHLVGRTKSFINVFGEELMVTDAEKALQQACHRMNCAVTDFTAAPIFFNEDSKGRHEWVIEFEKEPQDLQAFIELMDQYLRDTNSDYDKKRTKNLALILPKVVVAPKGTFYRWMKSRGKLGGQNKVPRLANERVLIDHLLQFIKEQEA